MRNSEVIETNVGTKDGHELLVSVNDDGSIKVSRFLGDRSAAVTVFEVSPIGAHELGSSLRFAAQKANERT